LRERPYMVRTRRDAAPVFRTANHRAVRRGSSTIGRTVLCRSRAVFLKLPWPGDLDHRHCCRSGFVILACQFLAHEQPRAIFPAPALCCLGRPGGRSPPRSLHYFRFFLRYSSSPILIIRSMVGCSCCGSRTQFRNRESPPVSAGMPPTNR